jgi:hypothetical protein
MVLPANANDASSMVAQAMAIYGSVTKQQQQQQPSSSSSDQSKPNVSKQNTINGDVAGELRGVQPGSARK